MKKPAKKPRPTQFEIALTKGDFKLPSELPRKFTFEDVLDGFMTLYLRLGSPGIKDFVWISFWKSNKRDRKKTAAELGISESALHKRIQRLKKNYKQSQP